jgi:hypothetical protein
MRKSLMLCCALLASLAAATVAAPAGFAQSAGDEQYVDPFQTEQGSGGGGGDTGTGGGGGGGGSDTGAAPEQPSVPETPTAEPPAETLGATPPTGSDPSASTEGSAAGEFALPRTGLPLLAVFGAGVLLLGGGLALRRSA